MSQTVPETWISGCYPFNSHTTQTIQAYIVSSQQIRCLLICPALFIGSGCTVSKAIPVENVLAEESRLTQDSANDFYPAWNVQGNKIGFVSDRTGFWNIEVMNSDGSDQQPLTHDRGQATSPSWSPDGSMIAYATDRNSGMRFWTDLWVMRNDGSFQESVSQTTTLKDLLPSWSPDGRYIAFLTLDMNAPPVWRMMLMEVNSRQAHEITRNKILFSRLAWSPDGKEIAFISDRTGRPELWIMDREGKQAAPITHDGIEKEHPDWSPDGKWIVFASRF